MYKRYRFKTKSVAAPRPLIDLKGIQMPYWISGDIVDTNTFDIVAVRIICYLPESEDLKKYWETTCRFNPCFLRYNFDRIL